MIEIEDIIKDVLFNKYRLLNSLSEAINNIKCNIELFDSGLMKSGELLLLTKDNASFAITRIMLMLESSI